MHRVKKAGKKKDHCSSVKGAALITKLEEIRQSFSRREARERSEREKSVLALFLAPAALRAGKGSQAFVAELSRQWNERYPRNRFFPGSYESIMKGFDANLLGLPLRKK